MKATGYLQLNMQQKQAILLAFQHGEECRAIPEFYDLMYVYPNLGLARKKEKIAQMLGSYHRG